MPRGQFFFICRILLRLQEIGFNMFRHIGSRRSYIHNLRLAVLLCFTAGFINAAGFLAFQPLQLM